ncbi:MAG TPA: hypothetical protein VLI06_20630 [Solimonas sp.]|nr:hypothetical protein [Solimonas sp.]
MPHRLLMLLLLWPAALGAAERLSLQVGRIEGDGWRLQNLQAELSTDSRLSARSGRIEAAALPKPLQQARLDCRLAAAAAGWRCGEGRLALQGGALGSAQGRFSLESGAAGWRLQLPELRGELSAQDAGERFVAEKLGFLLATDLQQRSNGWQGQTRLELTGGQGYADPVYGDFSAHPLQLQADWQLQLPTRQLSLSKLQLQQQGVGQLQGSAALSLRAPKTSLQAQLQASGLQLAPVAELYLQPFLAGSRMAGMTASGTGSAGVEIRDGAPRQLSLQLQQAGVDAAKPGVKIEGLDGELHWNAQAPSPDSRLRWDSLRYGKLETAGAELAFRLAARDFDLLAPLRIALYGGALNLRQLRLQRAGQPQMSAAFDADIEPIDLAGLSRAFGWPEFQGTLSGHLPGMRLENEVLSLDGALSAKVFDGDVTIDGLRVIQPFGVLPRVAADLRLRNLDLKTVTSAFSFGRMEGRLSGDFLGLRLLGWRPVAMNARLYTPPGDRSRHRISQRAIDSISRAGGGPSGLLQRSALRLFDDFAYERIGWSCRLDNGICEMDGIEPAKAGGYVLVKGRLLPRIDVVGYSRRVGWDTFLSQLKAAMDADRAEVRRE